MEGIRGLRFCINVQTTNVTNDECLFSPNKQHSKATVQIPNQKTNPENKTIINIGKSWLK